METHYKKISPADVYTSMVEGATVPFTGNNYIDTLAMLIRRYGNVGTASYAKLLGATPEVFSTAIEALTGMSAHKWITEYLYMEACELLEKTNLPITEIGKRLHFSSISTFNQFFLRMSKEQPFAWRSLKQTGKRITYRYEY